MRTAAIVALVVGLSVFTGCAMITGTATGALTGAVDAPAETYRHNVGTFEEYPMLHGGNVLIMGPIGIGTGPVLGLTKGLALDVQCCIVGDVRYGDVFGTYGQRSIWRPYTSQWPASAPKEPKKAKK